jgi:hypothetical protein
MLHETEKIGRPISPARCLSPRDIGKTASLLTNSLIPDLFKKFNTGLTFLSDMAGCAG